jgi:hypothetical protein
MERNLQLGASGEIDAKESIWFWIAQPQQVFWILVLICETG